jgi:hypothetical protein
VVSAVSESCFGVEPCSDGSVVIAANEQGALSVTRVEPGVGQSSRVVEFVRSRAQSPRICVASYNGRGLNLALALGSLPDAEVILLRPELLGAGSDRAVARGQLVAVALAGYARRAA